jgi:TetR/AcrR family transcriptional repressor of nem operon
MSNVAWLAKILFSMDTLSDTSIAQERALAIYAAIGGAQLTARSRADISAFDKIVESYRVAGLIPG